MYTYTYAKKYVQYKSVLNSLLEVTNRNILQEGSSIAHGKVRQTDIERSFGKGFCHLFKGRPRRRLSGCDVYVRNGGRLALLRRVTEEFPGDFSPPVTWHRPLFAPFTESEWTTVSDSKIFGARRYRRPRFPDVYPVQWVLP